MNHDGNMECYSDFRCIKCIKYVDNEIGNCFKPIHRKRRKTIPKNRMDYKIASVVNFERGFVGNASLVRGIMIL